jgi:hypothetical protein
MSMNTNDYDDDLFVERSSGIPPRGRLGASRNEMIGLVVALIVIALMAIGFWYESMP